MVIAVGEFVELVDVAAQRLHRSVERLRHIVQAVGDVVLTQDETEQAAPVGHGPHRVVAKRVLQSAEAIGHVGGDDRDLPGRVARVQEREDVADGLLAHVRDVHEDPLVHHPLHQFASQRGETLGAGLVEHEVVDRVGEERQRGSVGGHLAEEQVRHRDVGDSEIGQLADVGLHLPQLVADVKPALDGMDQDRPLAAQMSLQLGG